MTYFFIFLLLLFFLYIYWRFFFFFRDPEREIPGESNNILSPADGTLIYIKKVTDGNLLFSTKKERKTSLQEFASKENVELPGYLVGIFMHPTSVHVNRAPIAGKVESVDYKNGTNLPMTLTWWRTNLRMKPYEKYASHLFSNERNIISFSGKIKVFIVQIADLYVNKIECWVKPGEKVEAGQRVGMIKMGSQVDIYIPEVKGLSIKAKIGDSMKAGESIIAKIGEIK